MRICIFFALSVILSAAKNLFFTSEYVPAFGGDNEFPGDYTGGETPDPFPNSEAKPAQADGSPLGESRSSPGIYKPRSVKTTGAFLLRSILFDTTCGLIYTLSSDKRE